MNSTKDKKEWKEKEKESYRGNVKFDSNWKIFKETDSWIFAIPLNKEAAKFADSYACGGQGARWCIGMKDDEKNLWDRYKSGGSMFLFAYNKNSPLTEIEYSKKYGKERRDYVDYACEDGIKYMIEIVPNKNKNFLEELNDRDYFKINIFNKNDGMIDFSSEDEYNMERKNAGKRSLLNHISYKEIIHEAYEKAHEEQVETKLRMEKREGYVKEFLSGICQELKIDNFPYDKNHLIRDIIPYTLDKILPHVHEAFQNLDVQAFWEDEKYILYSFPSSPNAMEKAISFYKERKDDVLSENLPLSLRETIDNFMGEFENVAVPFIQKKRLFAKRQSQSPIILFSKNISLSDIILINDDFDSRVKIYINGEGEERNFDSLFKSDILRSFSPNRSVFCPIFIYKDKDSSYDKEVNFGEKYFPFSYDGEYYYYMENTISERKIDMKANELLHHEEIREMIMKMLLKTYDETIS